MRDHDPLLCRGLSVICRCQKCDLQVSVRHYKLSHIENIQNEDLYKPATPFNQVLIFSDCLPLVQLSFVAISLSYGLPRWCSGKESACQCKRLKRCGFNPWVGKIPCKEMATHSSILARKIPWTEEPSGLQFTGLEGVRHD